MNDAGYIYVKGWNKFQHPDAIRSAGPGAAWIKNYVGLLDNDAYQDLAPSFKGVLHMIWILTARNGQGRCSARADHLQRACNLPAGLAQKSLKALIQAGFIEVRASKAQAARKPKKRREDIQKKRMVKKPSQTVSADTNGDHSEDPPLSREERQREAQEALARFDVLPVVKEL